jgi:hypothetical protein
MRRDFCDGFSGIENTSAMKLRQYILKSAPKTLSFICATTIKGEDTSLEAKLRPAEEVCYHL